MKFLLAVTLGLLALSYVKADCDKFARFKVKLQWYVAYGTEDQRRDLGVAMWHA